MIAGIMQPYFFPYFGYFDHISRCDSWVVFDISQYTPKSWMNRNRILHPSHSWQYIHCDVHGSQNMSTCSVKACNIARVRERILGQLVHYKKHAPHYHAVIKLIKQSFDSVQTDSLTAVNTSGLSAVCKYLGLAFNPIIASQANFSLPHIAHPGQWALEICSLLGADVYLNPPGGRELFRPQEFASRGIRLGFTRVPDFRYACEPYSFEPCLSILDVLMWNSPEKICSQLKQNSVDFVS